MHRGLKKADTGEYTDLVEFQLELGSVLYLYFWDLLLQLRESGYGQGSTYYTIDSYSNQVVIHPNIYLIRDSFVRDELLLDVPVMLEETRTSSSRSLSVQIQRQLASLSSGDFFGFLLQLGSD